MNIMVPRLHDSDKQDPARLNEPRGPFIIMSMKHPFSIPGPAAMLLAALLASACGNEGSGGDAVNDDGLPDLVQDADVPDVPPVLTTCERPELPVSPLPEITVGDGSASSCTEGALADAVAAGGRIVLDCGSEPHTIPLSGTLQVTVDGTVIDGRGTVTLDGQGSVRVIRTDNHITVTLKDLGIRSGRAQGDSSDTGSGGGVFRGWRGTLVVTGCEFSDNAASTEGEIGGGAIYSQSGGTNIILDSRFTNNSGGIGGAVNSLLSDLIIVDSVFVGNRATDAGGAVYTDGGIAVESGASDKGTRGVIRICGSRFEGNEGGTQGGAAFLFAYGVDRVEILLSSFARNTVMSESGSEGLGGAVRGSAVVTVAGSTFEENRAGGQGGALWFGETGGVSIVSSTFVRNRAESLDGAEGLGGAIAGSVEVAITSCTLVENFAGWTGGAIFASPGYTLKNTLLAFNSAFNGGNPWNIDQTCSDGYEGDHNLQWPESNLDNPSEANCTPGILVAEPLLGELGDHGGFTRTVPLLEGSPGIDGGDPETCPETDQRGTPRAGTCDIGAFEYEH
jgi:predicted outer membrane repeat protein